MTTNFYIVKEKKRKKDGRVPVYISVSANFGRVRRPTSVYVLPDNWDLKKCKIKNKEPFSFQLNHKIECIGNAIHLLFANNEAATVAELELEILKITKSEVAGKILEEVEGSGAISFTKLVARMNEQQQYEVSKNTIIARQNLASLVTQFDNGVALASIDSKWMLSFRAWLAKKSLMNNTINIYVSRVSAVLKFAEKNKYIEKAPAKINTLKNKDSVVIYLTAEELAKFETTEAKKNYHLLDSKQVAKDYFLFMCYTGVRFSDFFLLTSANIKAGNEKYASFLDYNAKKNNIHVICPLTKKALDLIEKYKTAGSALLFPKMDKTKLFNNIKQHAKDSGLNSLVVDSYYVGNELIQLPTEKYKLLSAHAARHTFATLYIANGGSIIYLQKLLGHVNLNMTQKYVELMKSNLDDDFFKVFGN